MDRILAGVERHVRSGDGWSAVCPAHPDRRPSLSVKRGDNGQALVCCHAGCATEDVMAALGLRLADLYVDRKDRPANQWMVSGEPLNGRQPGTRTNGRTPTDRRQSATPAAGTGRRSEPAGDRTTVAEYTYRDERGVELFRKVRRADKSFGYRRNTTAGVEYKLGDARRVLYRLPELVAAVRASEPVYVVEGEKDADRLAGEGLAATTNHDGASGKWEEDYNPHFAGAHVVIVADRDKPGYRHARAVLTNLSSYGGVASVRVMAPATTAEHDDLSDHLDAGHTLEQLVPIEPDELARLAGETAAHTVATGDASVAELRKLASDTKGSESRAADQVVQAVLLGRFRYNPGLGWLGWDGRRWDGDETVSERVSEATRQFMDQVEWAYEDKAAAASAAAAAVVTRIKTRLHESALVDDKGRPLPSSALVANHGTDTEKEAYKEGVEEGTAAKTQADIWLNLLAAGKVAAVTRLCQGMDGILTRSSEFDSHPDLLNCRNCVVDLRDKSTRPHDPDLLITHLAGGDYDPAVRSDTWERALDAVHPDVADWYRMRMGQGATGFTPDDDALILGDGAGENGKSAVTGAIRRGLGSYARLISHRVLIAQPGQHPTELMDLRGLRFALLEETPEEGRLNTHQLKMTIGTPQITARRMRRDDITFDTTHTLMVNTNHRPIVDTTDHGTWRRLKAMPWPYTFRKPGEPCDRPDDKPGDPTIKPRLETEPDVPTAVLTWLVDGAATWYAQDRISGPDPDMVREATDEWRGTSDVGLRFAKEHLKADLKCYIAAATLRAAFNDYLGAEGKHPWTATTINERFPASLAAASIPITATPRKPTTITAAHRASNPGEKPPPSPPESTPDNVDLPPTKPKATEAVGKNVRVWAGVRFRYAEETTATDDGSTDDSTDDSTDKPRLHAVR